MQTLQPKSQVANLNDPNTHERIKTLWPQDVQLPSPIDTTAYPAPAYKTEDVIKALYKSKSTSSPGYTGLRFSHLKSLIPFGIAATVTRIVNLFFTNRLPDVVRNNVPTGLITPLEKTDNGIRPIIVLDVYIRLLSKLVLQSAVHMAIEKKVFINQFGISTKNAIYQIPNAVRTLATTDPTQCLLDLDIKGAFNNVSRQRVFEAAMSLGDAALIHYVNLLYTVPTSIVSRTDFKFQVTSGVLQGDAVSSLLFCLAINPTLLRAKQVLKDGFSFGFHDDIKLAGHAPQLLDTYNLLRSDLAEIQLQFNHDKCKVYPFSDQASTAGLSDLFPVVNEGLNVLGTTIGTPLFESNFAIERANKTIDKLAAIQKIPSIQLQYHLVRFCICTRLHHLARTVPPQHLQQAANIHSKAIQTFVHEVLVNPNDVLPLAQITQAQFQAAVAQFTLPVCCSGLGLADISQILPLVFLAAFRESFSALCARFSETSAPRAFSQVLSQLFNGNSPLKQHLQDAFETLKTFSTQRHSFDTPALDSIIPETEAVKLQHKYSKAFYIKQQFRLLKIHQDNDASVDPDTKLNARINLLRLRSISNPGALAFLHAIPSVHPLSMRNDRFAVALRRVLGLPILPPSFTQFQCICGAPVTDHHLVTCSRNYFVSHRHNRLRDLFITMLHFAKVSAIPEPLTNDGQTHYDIVAHYPAKDETVLYDVSVTSVYCVNYLQSANAPLNGQAITDKISEKHNKYGHLVQFYNSSTSTTTFTPLVFDNFGHASHSVGSLIQRAAKFNPERPPHVAFTASSFSNYWRQVLSLALHDGTVALFLDTLKKLNHDVNYNAAGDFLQALLAPINSE